MSFELHASRLLLEIVSVICGSERCCKGSHSNDRSSYRPQHRGSSVLLSSLSPPPLPNAATPNTDMAIAAPGHRESTSLRVVGHACQLEGRCTDAHSRLPTAMAFSFSPVEPAPSHAVCNGAGCAVMQAHTEAGTKPCTFSRKIKQLHLPLNCNCSNRQGGRAHAPQLAALVSNKHEH